MVRKEQGQSSSGSNLISTHDSRQLITCRRRRLPPLALQVARPAAASTSSSSGFRWCGEGVVCSHDDDSTSEHARARAQTTVIIVLTYADDAFPSTLLAVLTRRSSSPRTLRLFLLSLV